MSSPTRRRRSSVILRSEYSDQIIKSNNLAENKLAIEAKHYEKAKQQTCKSIESEQQVLQTLLQQQSNKRRMSLPVIRIETAHERLMNEQCQLLEKCQSFLEETKKFTSTEKLSIPSEELEGYERNVNDSRPQFHLGEHIDTEQCTVLVTEHCEASVQKPTNNNNNLLSVTKTKSAPTLGLNNVYAPKGAVNRQSKRLPSETFRSGKLSKWPLTASTSNINKETTLTVPKISGSRSAEHLSSLGRSSSPTCLSAGKNNRRRWSDETKPKIGQPLILPSLPCKSNLTGFK